MQDSIVRFIFGVVSRLWDKGARGSLDTAVGVFGIIHRLGACEGTASGLESRWRWRLRSHRDSWSRRSRHGRNRGLRPVGETILHVRRVSVRRRAHFDDLTEGRGGRGRQLGVRWDAREGVGVAGVVGGDRGENGGRSIDPWGWSARRERWIFRQGGEIAVQSGGCHLALDIVELVLLLVRVEWA